MNNGLLSATILQRDGTGQAERQQPALNPEYIAVEERSLEDWIVFAKQYAAELNFFGADDTVSGTWKAFLADVNIPDLLAYIENPDLYEGTEQAGIFSRPHLVLFISFLQLLGFIKNQLNAFTKKHLDFYYYEILGLTKKAPLPDEANIIIQLADDVNEFFIAQGTQLLAGKDSLNKDLVYETAKGTIISQAQVQKIKTFYTGKKTITLQQISDDITINKPGIRLLKMLQLAFGQPAPGGNLPLFNNLPVDITTLQTIRKNIATDAKSKLYISDILFLLKDDFIYIIDNYEDSLADWERIATIIRDAYRQKIAGQNTTTENSALPEPVLQQWENAYAISDAKASAFTAGSTDNATLYFNTFGKGHNANEIAAAKPAAIGFAISSPLLLLQEGVRTITLTLVFSNTGSILSDSDAPLPFSFFISTAKGWLAVAPQSFLYGNVNIKNSATSSIASTFSKTNTNSYNALQVQLKLAETDAAITPPDALSDVMNIQSNYPVLAIILNQDKEETENSNYSLFKDLQLQKVNVQVQVEKIKKLFIQNDDAVLDYKKPFEPFGLNPETSSRFYFAHPELCSKILNTLTLHFDWMNKPDFAGYYKSYSNGLIKSDNDFKAGLKLVENNIAVDVSPIPLFSNSTINIATGIQQKNPGFIYSEYDAIEEDEEAITWQRYFTLELGAPDFQHKAYPQLLTQQAYDNAIAIGKSVNGDTTAVVQPPLNPPYTPVLKSFTADYTAYVEIDIDEGFAGQNVFYHINAFGYNIPGIQVNQDVPAWIYFLPQFENEGELYIGINNISAPQNLSLFFQLAEGSADPDLEKPNVSWSYLSNNEWLPLQGSNLVHDSTNELLNSGIIEFAFPSNITSTNTLLAENLYWLRAAVTENVDAIPDTVNILTQGIAVSFIDNGNAPEHYAMLLPPESIKETVEGLPEVKKITQPYSSSKGKPAEDDNHFYVRVSERLRHKARALTAWDYEHIILEQFPEIYKVKCVPGDSIGSADIIVIPDVKGKLPFNPFEPKAPADVINSIQQYIGQRVSAWAEVKVKNPSYIQVRVRIAIKIKEDYSTDFFAAKLKEELIKYLAPWAYDEGADIFIDRRIDADVIVNFAAERFYIEYVSDVHLFTSRDGEHFAEVSPLNGEVFVQAEKPGDILVSDDDHVIDVIEDIYKEKNYKGIGYMKVELDFKIG